MITLRRLAPGEFDPERLALLVLGGTAFLGSAWLLAGGPLPPCWFHRLTGIPCLTCGGTRSVREILSGDLAAALGWNPLVFFGMGALAVFMLYAAAVVALRLPRVRPRPLNDGTRRILWVAFVVIAAANWIYLVLRGV